MNLIQQFPDVSAQQRAKNKSDERSFRTANARRPTPYAEDPSVVKYYHSAFRSWHIKFAFIVAATLGLTYYFILESFWIFQWIAG